MTALVPKIGDFFVPFGTSQHWVVFLLVHSPDPARLRIVCFRNGLRKTFSPWERRPT